MPRERIAENVSATWLLNISARVAGLPGRNEVRVSPDVWSDIQQLLSELGVRVDAGDEAYGPTPMKEFKVNGTLWIRDLNVVAGKIYLAPRILDYGPQLEAL
jgi:hypothetical protein